LPKTPALCYLPTYDPSCKKVWDIFQAGSDFAETYSLVSVTSGLKYIETPAGANNGTLYNDVPPGNYNLVSDSGCTSPVSFPNHATITVSAVSFVSCLGNTKITCEATPPSLSTCAGAYPFRFGLYNKKDSFIASNKTGEFLNMDTGVYIIKLLYDNTLSFNILPAWPDTVCAIDTEMVYVTNRPLPFIAAKQVKVCGQVKADIPFTIYGGAAPYTLQIQGYPAVNVNSNAGIYPNVSPGIYTLIVFDDCGISNSFSVSVLDSCSGCSGLSANFKVADSIVCKNSKVNFINQSNNADSYLWKVNGINYGTQPDTSLLAKTGSYTVTLYAFKTTCKDSFTITIKTVDSIQVKLENDTIYCGSFSRVLSTGAPATLWSTGVIAHQITVTQAGVYWAQLSNACGVSRDSITILERYFPAFDLGADTSVCNGDSVLLKVSVDSASFLWSNGSVDSFVLLKNQPANPVWIRISRNGCERSDSIRVYFLNPPQPFTLGVDTYFCENSPFLLSTSDTNTVWSTGVKGSFITVSDSGTYIATIANICGSQADTIHLNKEVIPQGFEVTADKVLVCESEPDSVLIKAVVNDNGQPPVIFSWNTGLRDTAYASSLLIDSSGTFFVKADNGKCSVSKEITIGRKFCGLECLEKYAIPNIFTPNEDGKNDTFKVLHLCPIDPFIMHIYDRWGGLLFESHYIEFGWDGKFKGKEQPEEVYVYWVCLGLPNRTEQKCLMGTVTLVR
jgi:gliding motility-associated-like protein